MLSGGPPHRGQGLLVIVLAFCDMEIGLVIVVFLTALDGILSSDLPGNFKGPWEFQHLLLKCLHCWLLAAGFVLRYEQQDCSIFMRNSRELAMVHIISQVRGWGDGDMQPFLLDTGVMIGNTLEVVLRMVNDLGGKRNDQIYCITGNCIWYGGINLVFLEHNLIRIGLLLSGPGRGGGGILGRSFCGEQVDT